MTKKVLIVGPCVSEFGWELMELQGYVRAASADYDAVVVSSHAARFYLYADIPNLIFVGHAIQADVTGHTVHRTHNEDEAERAQSDVIRLREQYIRDGYTVTDFVMPVENNRFRVQFRQDGSQKFIRLGKKFPRILIHARNKRHTENGEQNYPVESWREIVRSLSRMGDVGCIGSTAESHHIEGTADLRGVDLGILATIMANAVMIVGPSSGPMHMASLCGCPHVVWNTNNRAKIRYQSAWNPHGTRVVYLNQDPCSPIDPGHVVAACRALYDELTTSRGVIYVCTGAQWWGTLLKSIKTLRLFYRGDVAVLTNAPDAVAVLESCGVRVIQCDGIPPNASTQTTSRYIKTRLHDFSPFDVSLYVDCDTVFLNTIDGVWKVLTDWRDIAMRTEQHSPTVGERFYDNNPVEREDTIDLCGANFPHYHSSTILFRKSQATAKLFKLWHREWAKYGMYPKRPRIQDQPALARALYLSGIAVETLPDRYNVRADPLNNGQITDDTAIYSLPVLGNCYDANYPALYDLAVARSSNQPSADFSPIKPTAPIKVIKRMGDT